MFFFFLCGISSFLLYFLFDYLEYRSIHFRGGKLLGYLSVILLVISVIGLIISSPKWQVPLILRIFSAIFSIPVLFFFLRSLFFEVSFYKDENENFVRTGSYKLCRHPGVLLLFLLLFFISLATGSSYLFYGAFLFSFLNLFITIFEDKVFLPYKFKEYEDYRRKVPFLFPKLSDIFEIIKNDLCNNFRRSR